MTVTIRDSIYYTMEYQSLSSTAKSLYAELVIKHKIDPIVLVSMIQLSAALNRHVESIRVALKGLRAIGLITWESELAVRGSMAITLTTPTGFTPTVRMQKEE